MRVFDTSAASLEAISDLLKEGEVVALPTETVYGLAADALNPNAVESIYTIKGRPSHNPLIIHAPDIETAQKYGHFNATALKLAEAFWPGPLTLVVEKTDLVPEIVTAGQTTVGIRSPNQPQFQAILNKLDRPVAAPSANPSNYISPTEAGHVVRSLEGRLKYLLDGGKCPEGVESTIVRVDSDDKMVLLRPGPISANEIARVAGVEVCIIKAQSEPGVLTSPGQMKKHYSPRTPLYIAAANIDVNQSIARIRFEKSASDSSQHWENFYLSDRSDPKQAEQSLYSLLQEIDTQGFAAIYVDPIPNSEAWDTVRDRLQRAQNWG
jgi:L-threonylcarbamoyladenylate synthase